MKYLILMGSPRKNGNTAALVEPFSQELANAGHEVNIIWLYDKQINGCTACRVCQNDWSSFACRFHDDMYEIFEGVRSSDVIVLATPIYCWYCTSPMKSTLDRLMYGMNKYYGEQKGPSLWAGKKVALIETCGYRPEKGSDLFEEGMKRYCKHSRLDYIGSLAVRDLGYKETFINEEKTAQARAFAHSLMLNLNQTEDKKDA